MVLEMVLGMLKNIQETYKEDADVLRVYLPMRDVGVLVGVGPLKRDQQSRGP